MKYDGIIFDLDGTLWDAVEEGHLVLLEYLKTQPDVTHLPTKEEYAGVMGLGMDDLAEKLFRRLRFWQCGKRAEDLRYCGAAGAGLRRRIRLRYYEGWEKPK